MPQRRAVYFPPRILSDLVLHYRDVDFHVHKLVLHQECEYFRAIVTTLQPAAASASASASASSRPATRAAAKRARCESNSSPPAAAVPVVASECVHSPPVACLQLPDSIGVLPCTDTDELQLFLEHVYFPCSHPFPPCIPKVRVDLSTIERDAALPLFPAPQPEAVAQYPLRSETNGCLMNPRLLSLIQHFHAERLWQQCIAVIRVQSAQPWQAWFWLSILARYELKEEEDRLIRLAALDKGVCDSEQYRAHAASFSPSLMLRLMQAIHESKKQ